MTTILKARNLKKIYRTGSVEQEVIHNLDLDIEQGDFTVIMGSSGAGKSTLMYALSGMDLPDAGTIEFDNTDITKLTPDQLAVFRRRHCGFVFQQVHMLDTMSLMDNALAAGLLVNPSKKEVLQKARALFEKVQLDEKTYRKKVTQVSGGEAQRAGIVRAAVNSPLCLFADEPTGALNSETGKAVLDVFTALNEEGQSIVMVTHDRKTALRASRIVYLKDGELAGELRMEPYTKEDPERAEKLNAFLADMGW